MVIARILVQRAQMRVDSSPQMLQVKGMDYFFLPVGLVDVVAWLMGGLRSGRHQCGTAALGLFIHDVHCMFAQISEPAVAENLRSIFAQAAASRDRLRSFLINLLPSATSVRRHG